MPLGGVLVGSYDSYERAQAAVDFLSDQKFPVENVTIIGSDLRQVERVTGRLTWGRVLAAGAGLGIALAGDLRVAAAGAKFTTAFAGIGLSSDSGLASRLVHCVGGSRAAELLLLPEPFLAETAAQWGLVHRVVEPQRVAVEAQALAARLAAGPTAAYRAIKAVLATAATDSLEDTLALEARLQTELGRTADHREAVEAFLEKRTPRFTGH